MAALAALLCGSCAALHNSVLVRPPARFRCGSSRYEFYRASAALARRPLAAATDGATDGAEADEGGVWDARSWRLTFDVGRTEGDESMPEDWAASGARMAFSVDVEVSSDDASSKDNEVGRGALALRGYRRFRSGAGCSAGAASLRGGGPRRSYRRPRP